MEAVSADATVFAEASKAAEEEEALCLIATAASGVVAAAAAGTLVAEIAASASRMATMPPPTHRLVPTLAADVVASEETGEEEETGTAADQAVGMTRATAVAHMMIDQADIATETDTAATAIVEAAPTSSRSVADESIATTTGREKTIAGSAATKAATKIRVSSDATNPAFLSIETKTVFVLVGIFCLPVFYTFAKLLRRFPSAFRHQG